MYIAVLVIIFRSTNKNLRDLEQIIQIPDHDPASEHKFKLFKIFKLILLCYITVVLCTVMLDMLFLSDVRWIVEVLDETWQMAVFISLGWYFRLHKSNIYYKLHDPNTVPTLTTEKEKEVIEKYTTSSNMILDSNSDIDVTVVVGPPK